MNALLGDQSIPDDDEYAPGSFLDFPLLSNLIFHAWNDDFEMGQNKKESMIFPTIKW